MEIEYKINLIPEPDQIIELYKSAQLIRPVDDKERIAEMFANSNIIVTAWLGEKLIGVARSITDWVWSCYLADLAIHPLHQKKGIGKRLVEITQKELGDKSMILLLSVPTALDYYPKIGFEKQNSSFIINRKN
ncbi:GNAT family N-acetyltransferase [Flavihumibacter rivuli]|uniref:GNAT family N-acetyltransferase n=1 Tax=Flavihumibacter rivuli TaxID=2838156 RepID=UPI001BDEF422|nr:GNAT family N-acetyltransferase [Flavihumibacter rivuli]ULQ58369.1 GNAT family N-acetyltransferase [Flavihumibacter rivuli]